MKIFFFEVPLYKKITIHETEGETTMTKTLYTQGNDYRRSMCPLKNR
ncbi:hypothetical protein [Mariniflexile sp. HMF6888]